MLRDSSANGPTSQDVGVSPAGGVAKLDQTEVKAEVKEEDGRKSSDSRPPSNKLPNGDSGPGSGIVYCVICQTGISFLDKIY